MDLMVNGEPRRVAATVVADLLPDELAGVAIALNGAVLPRAEHATTTLTDGDRVEIVTAVQGG